MTTIKKIAALTLALLIATSVSAGNDKEKSNNGNHYGQIKNGTLQPPKPATSVPEPATLALLGAGVLAAGVSAAVRRRNKK